MRVDEKTPDQSMSQQSRFFRNSAFGMVAGMLSALGSLFTTIIVARLLNAEGAGALALGIWVAATMLVITDLGIPVTIARFLPELASQGSASLRSFAPSLARPFRLSVLAGILAIVLFGLVAWSGVAPSINAGQPSPVFWLMVAGLFGFQAFASFGLAQLRGLQRFDEVAKLAVLSFVLQMLVTAIGSLLFGVPGAFMGYVAGNLLPALWPVGSKRDLPPVPDEVGRRAWTYARTSWLTAVISAVVWTRIEVLPLQIYWGVTTVGLFSVTLTLSQIATQLPTLMMSGLLPHFSERHVAGDQEGLQRTYASTLVFLSFLLLPACFGMAAIAPAILPALFGQDFAPAVPAAEILAIGASIVAISAVNANVIYAVERADFFLKAGIGSAVLMVLAAIFIIPPFGVIGATASRAVIQGGIALLSFWFVRVRLGCLIPYGPLMRLAFSAALCAVAARVVVVSVDGPLELPLSVLAGVVVYVAAIRVLRAVPETVAAQLRRMLLRATPQRFSPVMRSLCLIVFGRAT